MPAENQPSKEPEAVDPLSSMIDKLKDTKDLLKSATNDDQVEVEETSNTSDLSQEKQMIMDFIPGLVVEFDKEIPFKILHERTLLDYPTIKEAILQLLMEKKLTGFLNDSATTDDLTDDILIIRDQRFVDVMEPSYRVG